MSPFIYEYPDIPTILRLVGRGAPSPKITNLFLSKHFGVIEAEIAEKGRLLTETS